MENKGTIKIAEVSGTELHHRYPGQTEPQQAQVVLDCRSRRLSARTNPEIGNAVAMAQWHGHIRVWRIQALRASRANALLTQIADLAALVCDGYSSEWDGSNHIARFTEDACKAIEGIEGLCDEAGNDEEDLINVWAASDWLGGVGDHARQAAEVGITAKTTDEEIEEIGDRLEGEARADGIDELEGLSKHLKALRAHMVETAPKPDPLVPCPRFRRVSIDDGASEILTVVQVEGREGYLVEICSGPEPGDDFIGMYDLDGDRLDVGNVSWTRAETAPASVVANLEDEWGGTHSEVSRLEPAAPGAHGTED